MNRLWAIPCTRSICWLLLIVTLLHISTLKKQHTHVKVALFITLLSFHALSSCVNTRQILGSNIENAQGRRYDNYDYDLVEGAQRRYNDCNESQTAHLVAGLWMIVFTVVYTSYIYVAWWKRMAPLGFNTTGSNGNSSTFTTLGPNAWNASGPSISNEHSGYAFPTLMEDAP